MSAWSAHTSAILLAALLTSAQTQAFAAPPVKEILEQLEQFRGHVEPQAQTWRVEPEGTVLLHVARVDSNWTVSLEGEGSTTSPLNDPLVLELLRCLLTCDDLRKGLEALGGTIDGERVSLHFDGDDTLVYTIGRAEAAGQFELQLERDVYRLREIQWVDEQGRRLVLTAKRYTERGWKLEQVAVSVGGQVVEIALEQEDR